MSNIATTTPATRIFDPVCPMTRVAMRVSGALLALVAARPWIDSVAAMTASSSTTTETPAAISTARGIARRFARVSSAKYSGQSYPLNANSAGTIAANSAPRPTTWKVPARGPGSTGSVNGSRPKETWAKQNPVNARITASSSTSIVVVTQPVGEMRPIESRVTTAIIPNATQFTGTPPGIREDRYVAAASRIEEVAARPSTRNRMFAVPPQTGPSARRTMVYVPPADGNTDPTSA